MYPHNHWLRLCARLSPYIQCEAIFALGVIPLVDKVGVYFRILRCCVRIREEGCFILRTVVTLLLSDFTFNHDVLIRLYIAVSIERSSD